MYQPSLEELCKGLKESYPAAITDIMDSEFHLHNQWLGPEIKPLVPEMRLAGPAYTMRWVNDPEIAEDAAYGEMANRLVNEMSAWMVPVIDTSKCKNAGYWGELMCTICSGRGIEGAVIDGGVRDPFFIYKNGFNMFSAFACPLNANLNRSRLVSLQKPIYINDVMIRPGDFMMGDFGGVVVVPKEIVMDVYSKVRELMEKESKTRTLIRQGATVKEMLKAGGRL
ncbi:MAG: RraA family protein [Planctomycetes bacterium]|nr:RraA family protein [Planctomycetota bacterium]